MSIVEMKFSTDRFLEIGRELRAKDVEYPRLSVPIIALQ